MLFFLRLNESGALLGARIQLGAEPRTVFENFNSELFHLVWAQRDSELPTL